MIVQLVLLDLQPTSDLPTCRRHNIVCLHASSSVDAQNLAVDPAAVIRGEEADHASDVDRQADTMHRRPACSVLVSLLVGKIEAIWT